MEAHHWLERAITRSGIGHVTWRSTRKWGPSAPTAKKHLIRDGGKGVKIFLTHAMATRDLRTRIVTYSSENVGRPLKRKRPNGSCLSILQIGIDIGSTSGGGVYRLVTRDDRKPDQYGHIFNITFDEGKSKDELEFDSSMYYILKANQWVSGINNMTSRKLNTDEEIIAFPSVKTACLGVGADAEQLKFSCMKVARATGKPFSRVHLVAKFASHIIECGIQQAIENCLLPHADSIPVECHVTYPVCDAKPWRIILVEAFKHIEVPRINIDLVEDVTESDAAFYAVAEQLRHDVEKKIRPALPEGKICVVDTGGVTTDFSEGHIRKGGSDVQENERVQIVLCGKQEGLFAGGVNVTQFLLEAFTEKGYPHDAQELAKALRELDNIKTQYPPKHPQSWAVNCFGHSWTIEQNQVQAAYDLEIGKIWKILKKFLHDKSCKVLVFTGGLVRSLYVFEELRRRVNDFDPDIEVFKIKNVNTIARGALLSTELPNKPRRYATSNIGFTFITDCDENGARLPCGHVETSVMWIILKGEPEDIEKKRSMILIKKFWPDTPRCLTTEIVETKEGFDENRIQTTKLFETKHLVTHRLTDAEKEELRTIGSFKVPLHDIIPKTESGEVNRQFQFYFNPKGQGLNVQVKMTSHGHLLNRIYDADDGRQDNDNDSLGEDDGESYNKGEDDMYRGNFIQEMAPNDLYWTPAAFWTDGSTAQILDQVPIARTQPLAESSGSGSPAAGIPIPQSSSPVPPDNRTLGPSTSLQNDRTSVDNSEDTDEASSPGLPFSKAVRRIMDDVNGDRHPGRRNGIGGTLEAAAGPVA